MPTAPDNHDAHDYALTNVCPECRAQCIL